MNTIPDYPALARLLTPLADPVRAVQMQAYMKNRFPFPWHSQAAAHRSAQAAPESRRA